MCFGHSYHDENQGIPAYLGHRSIRLVLGDFDKVLGIFELFGILFRVEPNFRGGIRAKYTPVNTAANAAANAALVNCEQTLIWGEGPFLLPT
jgi:hypothetical protein